MNTISKPPIHRVFLWQIAATLLISVAIFPLSRVGSYSFLLGCLIQVSGNLYFARLAFRYRGASQARSVVQSMYRGETGKIVLTGAMFAAVFVTIEPLSAPFVLVGYLAMLLLYTGLMPRCLSQKF